VPAQLDETAGATASLRAPHLAKIGG